MSDVDTSLSNVVSVWSAHGGTGKSVAALALAQLGAARGLKVALVDAARDTDLSTYYLRVGAVPAHIGSRHPESLIGSRSVLLSPEEMRAIRPRKGAAAGFHLLTRDAQPVGPHALISALRYLAPGFDMVVVDSPPDPFDVGGHSAQLAVIDPSAVGISMTLSTLAEVASRGLHPGRSFLIANRVASPFVNWNEVREAFSPYAQVLAQVPHDQDVFRALNRGDLLPDPVTSRFATVLDKLALHPEREAS